MYGSITAGARAMPTTLANTQQNWTALLARRHSGGMAARPSMALQSATRTVPIVFVTVIDPVGAGFIESLARPGGNATGFTQ